MAADDEIDAGDRLGEFLVDIVADVREHDDLVDPGLFKRADGTLHILGDALEFDVADRRNLGRLLGGGADHGDLLAADIEDDDAARAALQVRIGRGVEVAADDGEFRRSEELRILGRAVVELVIAGGDHVEAHVVHEIGDDLALVLGVEERALEVVAGRQQYDVLAGVP